jgi:N-acetylglucosamine kinase-like BadF-type ATPase
MPLAFGVDGGNSKVDLALVDAQGRLLAAGRGPTVSHQAVALDVAMARLNGLANSVAAEAHAERSLPVDVLVASLAGADYPRDVGILHRAIERLGIARQTIVVNDTIGALRAGASSTWGVALVCGQGINAAAVAPDGREARFPAVGDIAGDWGGGGGVGMAGLQAAIRGSDGRGPRTSLERAVPAFFGLRRPSAVTRALYYDKISGVRISGLSPVVFGEAAAGDPVARAIVTRLAAELAGMANALIRRLHLTRQEVEVVLAGGVFRTRDQQFYRALEDGIHGTAPRARLVNLAFPPVAGAVLLALDRLARRAISSPPDPEVSQRLRDALGAWDRAQETASTN